MSIYAIGDVQGCFDDLQRLLVAIDFHKKRISSGLSAIWLTEGQSH